MSDADETMWALKDELECPLYGCISEEEFVFVEHVERDWNRRSAGIISSFVGALAVFARNSTLRTLEEATAFDCPRGRAE